MGRFKAVRQTEKGVILEYTAGEATVQESIQLIERNQQSVVLRNFEVSASNQPLLMTLGYKTESGVSVRISKNQPTPTLEKKENCGSVRVPPHSNPIQFCVSFTESGTAPAVESVVISNEKPNTRWPQKVTTETELSIEDAAYVVVNILLPLNNPWKRNVRFADIQFQADGTGVVATLDGDVWLVKGLKDSLTNVRWQRFTSGLHEPMTVAIRDDQIFVFDRNGIWRLLDTDKMVRQMCTIIFKCGLRKQQTCGNSRAPSGSHLKVSSLLQKEGSKKPLWEFTMEVYSASLPTVAILLC